MKNPNFSPRKINKEEFQKLEDYYSSEVFGDVEKMEQVWKELHGFFKDVGSEVDFSFYPSFFRWYTDITWDLFRSWDKKYIENVAIKRQIFLAALQGYRVLDRMLLFIGGRSINQEEAENLYTKYKQAFKDSSAIIYKKDEEDVFLVSDLITKVNNLDSDEESLKKANMLTDIKDNLKDNHPNIIDYVLGDIEQATDNMFRLNNFFEMVEKDNIFQVAQTFINPELEEKYVEFLDNKLQELDKNGDVNNKMDKNKLERVKDNFGEDTKKKQLSGDKKEEASENEAKKNNTEKKLNKKKKKESNEVSIEKDESKEKNTQNDNNFNEQKKNKNQSSSTADSESKTQQKDKTEKKEPKDEDEELKKAQENVEKHSSISFQEIKQTVDAQFDKDENGQYESIEGVMKVLDSIARQQDNDDIRNLYYFDQQDGKFKWDKDLLEKDE